MEALEHDLAAFRNLWPQRNCNAYMRRLTRNKLIDLRWLYFPHPRRRFCK